MAKEYNPQLAKINSMSIEKDLDIAMSIMEYANHNVHAPEDLRALMECVAYFVNKSNASARNITRSINKHYKDIEWDEEEELPF